MITPKNLFTSDQVVLHLEKLRLPGFKAKYLELMATPSSANLSLTEALGVMLEFEANSRLDRRVERYLKESGMRRYSEFADAFPENLKLDPQGIKIETFKRLISCDWIRETKPSSVVITGPSGTGKTWLAFTIGRCACLQNIQTQYIRFPDLLTGFSDALEHNNNLSHRNSLNQKKLLIIDDLGLGKVNEALISEFLSLLEERLLAKPTIIVSQIAPEAWYTYFGQSHGTDALIDRLLNYCYDVKLVGHSLRELENPTI